MTNLTPSTNLSPHIGRSSVPPAGPDRRSPQNVVGTFFPGQREGHLEQGLRNVAEAPCFPNRDFSTDGIPVAESLMAYRLPNASHDRTESFWQEISVAILGAKRGQSMFDWCQERAINASRLDYHAQMLDRLPEDRAIQHLLEMQNYRRSGRPGKFFDGKLILCNYLSAQAISKKDLESVSKRIIINASDVNLYGSSERLQKEGSNLILNLDVLHPDKRNLGKVVDQLSAGADAIHLAMQADQVGEVVVHCLEGMNRSASLVAAYLIKYKGITVNDAVATVKKERPVSQLSAAHKEALSHLSNQGIRV